jgi:hypothetical protein
MAGAVGVRAEVTPPDPGMPDPGRELPLEEEGDFGVAAEAAVQPGTPGLSYHYVMQYGNTKEPYFLDTAHTSTPTA